ncbi:FecR/PupR family sigma factor regulator [Halopseudomonas salegens]|uniref:FecR/PupR family sigma factor regulator n=1 Tax=Halopseudomonas salegens TaxID=1434072 RepID=UPI000B812264|nr:FecR/PupR family sigma factor regulator [Halopseudomonas salegens]
MSAVREHQDIPERVLDQAIGWAVIMGDSSVDEASREAFDEWLQAHPLHGIAWQRLQMIEREFSAVHPRLTKSSNSQKHPLSRQPRADHSIGVAGVLLLGLLLAMPLILCSRVAPDRLMMAPMPHLSVTGLFWLDDNPIMALRRHSLQCHRCSHRSIDTRRGS